MGTVEPLRTPLGVADLAARLERRLPELTERVVTEILHVEQPYHEVPDLTRDELRDSVTGSMTQFIRKLVNRGAETYGYLTFLTDIGRRRVEQGLPLESLLHAFRIGARTIWEGLREEADQATGREVVQEGALVEGATAIWELHEAVSARMAAAYRDAELSMLRRRELQRSTLIDGLLEGRGQEASFARDAAFALRLRLSGRYLVVLAETLTPGVDALPGVERTLAGQGFTSAWRGGPPRTAGIVDLGDGDVTTLGRLLEQSVRGRVGVSTVVGSLADLQLAHQLAETALGTLGRREPAVAMLGDCLPAALLAAAPQVAAVLMAQTLGALSGVEEYERATLLSTVRAYVDHGGSAKDTALAIHCHRNTVLKRLRRFEELTGQSLADPATRLCIALAVRAVPMLPEPATS